MLVSNPLARHVAGQLMQIQRDAQPLLTGQAAVMLDLFVECGLRRHNDNVMPPQQESESKLRQTPDTALRG
jgi:hypothetical protein